MKEQKSNIEDIFTTFFLSIHIYNFGPLFMFYKLLAICLLGITIDLFTITVVLHSSGTFVSGKIMMS